MTEREGGGEGKGEGKATVARRLAGPGCALSEFAAFFLSRPLHKSRRLVNHLEMVAPVKLSPKCALCVCVCFVLSSFCLLLLPSVLRFTLSSLFA